jgi:hypothetical protein
MKDISSVESLVIPEGVTVAIKSRIVTVEGPRGKLVKNVGHVQMDIQLVSVGRGAAAAAAGVVWVWEWQGCNWREKEDMEDMEWLA